MLIAGRADADALDAPRLSQATNWIPNADEFDGRDGIDRDALLTMLFPNGMPAREELLQAARGWLDEAERLSQTR